MIHVPLIYHIDQITGVVAGLIAATVAMALLAIFLGVALYLKIKKFKEIKKEGILS